MFVLPVVDLLGGVVVRGVGGRRDEYRPVISRLTDSSQPVDVALAFRRQLGLNRLYVADLDGIQRGVPSQAIIEDLSGHDFEIWLDAGIRQPQDAEPLFASGAAKIIAGLESLAGPESLAELVRQFGSARMVFSLDLKAGRPLGSLEVWPDPSPIGIVQSAQAAGVTQIIVLDLASVGECRGPSTLPLCDVIHRALPDVQLVTGGGIRHVEDLRLLRSHEIAGVLLASALHDGSLSRTDLESETC